MSSSIRIADSEAGERWWEWINKNQDDSGFFTKFTKNEGFVCISGRVPKNQENPEKSGNLASMSVSDSKQRKIWNLQVMQ